MNTTPSPPPAPPGGRGLARALVEDLERLILTGEMGPGVKLPSEKDLIDRFGVSRTVVREALSRLQAAGLIETFQGRGSFVIDVPQAPRFGLEAARIRSHTDVLAMIGFRIGVESEAAALAAVNASPDSMAAVRAALDDLPHVGAPGIVEADFAFHRSIAVASGNRFYVELLDSLGPMMIMLPRTRLDERYAEWDPEHGTRVRTEHEAVVEGIEDGDADSARAAMRLHLTNSRRRLRSP